MEAVFVKSFIKEHLLDERRLLGPHLAVLPNAAIRVLSGQATPGPPIAADRLLIAREPWPTGGSAI